MNSFKSHHVAALFAAALMVPAAAAAQPMVVEGGLPTISVTYADLNLASDAGRERLLARVRGAATRLCQNHLAGVTSEQIQRRSCYRAAIADARNQMNQAVADNGRTRLAGRATITVAAR